MRLNLCKMLHGGSCPVVDVRLARVANAQLVFPFQQGDACKFLFQTQPKHQTSGTLFWKSHIPSLDLLMTADSLRMVLTHCLSWQAEPISFS